MLDLPHAEVKISRVEMGMEWIVLEDRLELRVYADADAMLADAG